MLFLKISIKWFKNLKKIRVIKKQQNSNKKIKLVEVWKKCCVLLKKYTR